ncbi:hypothetical protein F3J29_11845 [Enterobacter sp. Cy-643]|uniref:hypothetical protein n=1 Tax=Enterobacter sp. Cy-643 TaxID=2608346 RepID=UPI00141F4DA8|nr:hypothetical protein [Enterobacter sp. Cy-643]NIF32820.1 hypothetical protein [Enterobacter sp. Cy-643]
MSTLIQINVTNNSPSPKNFYFFQQPAIYSGGSQVYTNSILSATILPSQQGGSVYTFLLNLQYYAGVQQRYSPPLVGQPSGYTSAIRPIELTPAAGGTVTNNCTNMVNTPALGLSIPTTDPSVQKGAFRIVSPTFNPSLEQYNGGSAVQLPNGSVVLSNFVNVDPTSNLDCQPILKFYVQTGTYTAGTVMNFTSSSVNAALCDATSGFTTFNVTYNADGTWTVVPGVQKTSFKATQGGDLIMNESQLNTVIKNEAGTAIVSRGYAANAHSPITVENLTNPGDIYLYGSYLVSVDGGPFIGTDCDSKAGSTATFRI